jgi:hypothetical protein
MKKTTSSKLSKQLAKYGALTAAIAGVADASGQIIYTDVTPDFTGAGGDEYFLDLNNDGTNDFRIFNTAGSSGEFYLFAQPLTASNDVLASNSGNFGYPFALSSGAPISNGANFWLNNGYSTGYLSLNYNNCSFGNWCSVTDRYLGLRFNIGGNTHYGWARLDVPNNAASSWTVKDYAYNTTAGDPINAGQETLSVESNSIQDIRIVALNKSIGLYNLTEATNYTLYNISGKQILTGTATSEMSVIEANQAASGVYILELNGVESNKTLRKKVIL